jgi:hypothetical protein
VDANNTPKAGNQAAVVETGSRRPGRFRDHQKAYLALLIFVAIAGLPIVGVPALRTKLRTRIQTLRAAAMGQPPIQAPASMRVGENPKPFPKEYEHAQAVERPSILPKIDVQQRQPYRIILGGDEGVEPATGTAAPVLKSKAATQPAPAPAAVDAGQPSSGGGTDTQYRKGKSEQEAYDLLVNSNQILAGMIKGSDPALKFQDWAAATMGQDSLYVMVTFVQTSDNVVRKYIWNVKMATKEIIPLSAYAREVSK